MIAKRWAFIICDQACQFYDIKLLAGQHVPLDADVDKGGDEKSIKNVESTAGGAGGGGGWVPSAAVAEAARMNSRYQDTDPQNEWGAVKSRSTPAGVVINEQKEWAPIMGGRSQHAFHLDRQRLEQQQYQQAPLPARPCRAEERWEDDWDEGTGGNVVTVASIPATGGGGGGGGGGWGGKVWAPQQDSKEATPEIDNSSEFPSLGGNGFPALGAPLGRGRGSGGGNGGGKGGGKKGRGRGRGVRLQMENMALN